MFKLFGLLSALVLLPSVALAQTCPTRPTGDNTNACASTAFVQNQIGSSVAPANPTAQVGSTAVNGSASTYMRSDAAPALSTTGVTAGTYGSSTQSPQITIDANGRITAASNQAIATSGLSSTTSVTGSTTTYTSAQNGVLVQRSNSGSHMADVLPGTSPGVLPANTIITVVDNDTGSVNGGLLAISAGSGALIKGSSLLFNGNVIIGPGQTVQLYSDGS